MSALRELCRRHTRLDEADIQELEALEGRLKLIADLTNADVFLDCRLDESAAIVVAQARPEQGDSAYRQSVVGQRALAEREPAVFHAFRVEMPVCDLKAITQEGRAVRQNAVPVRNRENRVIAVLIREKDVSGELLRERKYEELARSYEVTEPSNRQAEYACGGESVELREMHHRIKNNLQLVASILNLQARRSADPNVRAILTQNVKRVLSISAIHDILNYDHGGAGTVSSRVLLERLRQNLQEIPPESQHLRLQTEGEEIFMTMDVAASVSLVITELVTNAFKHAFAGRPSGTVLISVCAGNLLHTVTVADDGVGFDPGLKRQSSLGLNIVRATVEDKLKGKLHIDSDESGTRVSFDFKRE